MASRLELQSELEGVLGTRNVYFQPPESIKLTYPCIIYSLEPGRVRRANNKIYNLRNKYEVTVITRDPDSTLPVTILKHFSTISHSSRFVTDNLYHDNFALYY